VSDYELYEGLQDSINRRINQYASVKGIHPSPGWIRNPEKRNKLNRDVAIHMAQNPKDTAKYAAEKLLSKLRPQPKPKPRIATSSKPSSKLTLYQQSQLERQRRKGTSFDRSTNPYYVTGTNR
jgi:hypothetical protein